MDLLQIDVSYNIPDPESNPSFFINVRHHVVPRREIGTRRSTQCETVTAYTLIMIRLVKANPNTNVKELNFTLLIRYCFVLKNFWFISSEQLNEVVYTQMSLHGNWNVHFSLKLINFRDEQISIVLCFFQIFFSRFLSRSAKVSNLVKMKEIDKRRYEALVSRLPWFGKRFKTKKGGTKYFVFPAGGTQARVLNRYNDVRYEMEACVRWLHRGASNMAVLEFKLLTGFRPDLESVHRVRSCEKFQDKMRF